jgi:hypothetical protein
LPDKISVPWRQQDGSGQLAPVLKFDGIYIEFAPVPDHPTFLPYYCRQIVADAAVAAAAR